MTSGPEYTDVEKPLLDQLTLMGWEAIAGDLDDPSVTGRESFREVLMRPALRDALRRINLRDGEPGSTTTASRRPSASWSGSRSHG